MGGKSTLPGARPFWTAYRRFFVSTLMAREESRFLIAEKLGVTRRQLNSAVHKYDLKPRPLLEAIEARGGGAGHMRCEGCGAVIWRAGHCGPCRRALRRSGLDPDTNTLIRRKAVTHG
jgi:hypothetical protein